LLRESHRVIRDGTFTEEKIADWDMRLSRVFNRGFWNGYYLGQKLGEWSPKYGSEATVKKVYIGKCTNYFVKSGVAEFLIETYDVKVGDEILITGPTTGAYEATLNEIRVDTIPSPMAKKGDTISIAVTERIRRNDKLFKWVDARLVNDSQ
jgi:putative protease